MEMIKDNKKCATVSVIALIVGLSVGTSAFAQDDSNDSWLNLGEISLFGAGLETSVMDSPASVTVIDEEDIKRIPAQTIGDLLRSIPGVQVDDGSFERIVVRGEGGNRVLIKIDGQALTDHNGMGLGTPILVDPATVERIEIIRGSSSVVGGTRAIGGVVNIITKKGGDKPFGGSFSLGYFSATDGYRSNLSLHGAQGGFDYRLNFGKTDLGDIKTPDGPLTPSDFQNRNISAHLGYSFGNHYVGLKLQDLDMATNVAIPGLPPFMTMSIGLPVRDLTKVGLFYEGTDLTPWMSELTASTYYQTVDREFAVRRTMFGRLTVSDSSDEQITSGFNADAVLEFAQGHRTKIGIEYENDFVDTSKSKLVEQPGHPPSITTTRDKARIKTLSVYALHEAELSDKLTGFLGARFYKVDADLEFSDHNPASTNTDTRFIGSASLVYKPNDNLALRFGLNQGYTYPNLTQMFISTTAGGTTINGNPNLVPEESVTAEFGARYDGGNTVIDATLFYTEAENYIARVADVANPGDDTYVNVSEAITYGIELYAEHTMENANLTPYISGSWLRRKYNSTYVDSTPELSGKIGVKRNWELANGIYGSLDAYMQAESSNNGNAGYGTLNIAAEAQLNKGLHLTASLNNILNKSYEPSHSNVGAERNIKLNLTWEF